VKPSEKEWATWLERRQEPQSEVQWTMSKAVLSMVDSEASQSHLAK
jgi:hypothetical protein